MSSFITFWLLICAAYLPHARRSITGGAAHSRVQDQEVSERIMMLKRVNVAFELEHAGFVRTPTGRSALIKS